MQSTDKYSEHSSIIWPVWLNGWVFVYELNGSGFEFSCSHLWWTFESPKTNILANTFMEKASFILDEIASKTVKGNRSKKPSEVRPVENTDKNRLIFSGISPAEKENLPSHKLQNHVHQ